MAHNPAQLAQPPETPTVTEVLRDASQSSVPHVQDRGRQGVGRATTQVVVISSVMIIVADTFLTKLALYLADRFF